MQTPDLTRAQILAVVKSLIAVAVAFGVPLHPSQQIALLALVGTLSVVLISADAMIRRARAQHLAGPLADQQAAQAIAEATTAAKGRSLIRSRRAGSQRAAGQRHRPRRTDRLRRSLAVQPAADDATGNGSEHGQ
jgi:hypothetical protein